MIAYYLKFKDKVDEKAINSALHLLEIYYIQKGVDATMIQPTFSQLNDTLFKIETKDETFTAKFISDLILALKEIEIDAFSFQYINDALKQE